MTSARAGRVWVCVVTGKLAAEAAERRTERRTRVVTFLARARMRAVTLNVADWTRLLPVLIQRVSQHVEYVTQVVTLTHA